MGRTPSRQIAYLRSRACREYFTVSAAEAALALRSARERSPAESVAAARARARRAFRFPRDERARANLPQRSWWAPNPPERFDVLDVRLRPLVWLRCLALYRAPERVPPSQPTMIPRRDGGAGRARGESCWRRSRR